MNLAETITKLMQTAAKLMQTAAPQVRLFEFSQIQDCPEKSSAVLKVMGMPALCPHCNSEVPPNHGHACIKRHIDGKWVWTRSFTPL
jgi:hypothetical protein